MGPLGRTVELVVILSSLRGRAVERQHRRGGEQPEQEQPVVGERAVRPGDREAELRPERPEQGDARRREEIAQEVGADGEKPTAKPTSASPTPANPPSASSATKLDPTPSAVSP
jgi:hypothetical protein